MTKLGAGSGSKSSKFFSAVVSINIGILACGEAEFIPTTTETAFESSAITDEGKLPEADSGDSLDEPKEQVCHLESGNELLLQIFSLKNFATRKFFGQKVIFDDFGELFVLGSSNIDIRRSIGRRIKRDAEEGFGQQIWFSKVNASSGEMLWSKSSRDGEIEYSFLSDVARHPSGGIRILGQEIFFDDEERVQLGRLLVGHVNRNGDFLWQEQIDESLPEGNLLGVAIESGADGSFTVLGIRAPEGKSLWWLGHFDVHGIKQWTKDIEPAKEADWISAQDMAISPQNGSFYIVGTGTPYTGSRGVGPSVLMRLSNQGELIWSRFEASGGNHRSNFIRAYNQHGVVVGGSVYLSLGARGELMDESSEKTGDKREDKRRFNEYALVQRFSDQGVLLWSHPLVTVGGRSWISDIRVTPDANIVVAGNSVTNDGYQIPWFRMMNAKGEKIWHYDVEEMSNTNVQSKTITGMTLDASCNIFWSGDIAISGVGTIPYLSTLRHDR